MRVRSIYLATPADQADRNPDKVEGWAYTLSGLKKILASHFGGYVFDPVAGFTTGNQPHGDMFYILDEAMRGCDLVVAILPAGVPSLGVPTEIEQALNLGKPVLLITDLQGTSWVLEKWRDRYVRLNIVSMGSSTDDLDGALAWVDALPELPSGPPPGSTIIPASITPGAKILPFTSTTPAEPETLMFGPMRAAVPADNLIKWTKVHPDGKPPVRAYSDDAGLDLCILEAMTIEPGAGANMATGVAIQLPGWTWGMITGRSSTWVKGLHVPVSVIDAGWRGPLFVPALNLTQQPVVLQAGDRIAQLIVMDNATRDIGEIVEVDELDPHDRGQNGFGSTGR